MKRQPDSQTTPEVDAFAERTGESVNAERVSIGKRMKAAMEAAGLTQARLAELIGSASVRGIQENVAGKTAPGGNVLSGLVRGGVNVNWVVAEAGPMLLKDLAPGVRDQVGEYRVSAAAPVPAIDMARLQLAIATIEEALEQARSTASPDGKAQLVAAAYDALRDSDIAHEQVLKLIKLAAQNTAIKQK